MLHLRDDFPTDVELSTDAINAVRVQANVRLRDYRCGIELIGNRDRGLAGKPAFGEPRA